jgi:hypothetical protein
MDNMTKLLKRKLIDRDINDFKELSRKTGIKYETMLDHLKRPGMFRAFELQALNEVLEFSDEELLLIIKGD